MYAFLQNCNSVILNGVKRIHSFLGGHFLKLYVIVNEHTCGIKKNKDPSVAFFFLFSLTFMLLNDQENILG